MSKQYIKGGQASVSIPRSSHTSSDCSSPEIRAVMIPILGKGLTDWTFYFPEVYSSPSRSDHTDQGKWTPTRKSQKILSFTQKRLRRGTRQQVGRQYYHRIGFKETAKITALSLPLSSTTLLEEIRGENNFSKYAQHRESSPNTSVQAVDTCSPTSFCNFQSKWKKKAPCYPGGIIQYIAQKDIPNILLRPIRIGKFNMLISEVTVGK